MRELPVIPLRDSVLFPRVLTRLGVGRLGSIAALAAAAEAPEPLLFFAAQRDAAVDEPRPEQLHDVGCIAQVLEASEREGPAIDVAVRAVVRARAVRFADAPAGRDPSVTYLTAEVEEIPLALPADAYPTEMLTHLARELAGAGEVPRENLGELVDGASAAELAGLVVHYLGTPAAEAQRILASDDPGYAVALALDVRSSLWRRRPEEEKRSWLRRLLPFKDR